MRYPWANTILLVLLLLQLATGVGALLIGNDAFRWVLWFHSIGGYAVVVLFLWKGRIIWGVIRRRKVTASRLVFLAMTLLLFAILGTGFYWTLVGPTALLGFGLLVLHGALGALLILPLLWHLLARWWLFRVPQARDRRAFLRLAGISLAGVVLWRGAVLWQSGHAPRRFTGSYEEGSLTGTFPAVSWLFDAPQPIERDQWSLTIGGAVRQPRSLSYAELLQRPAQTRTETLDCTGGWYSVQVWQGISLSDLLEEAAILPGARSITVRSATGYERRFPLEAARHYLLATHVGAETLSHGHGAPLRLVAGQRRGYDWVKWVVHLEVNESSAYWQPPLPLQ